MSILKSCLDSTLINDAKNVMNQLDFNNINNINDNLILLNEKLDKIIKLKEISNLDKIMKNLCDKNEEIKFYNIFEQYYISDNSVIPYMNLSIGHKNLFYYVKANDYYHYDAKFRKTNLSSISPSNNEIVSKLQKLKLFIVSNDFNSNYNSITFRYNTFLFADFETKKEILDLINIFKNLNV